MLRPRDTAGVTPEMRDRDTPPDVAISATAPPPFVDPTLGVPVPPRAYSERLPRNRLVAIGDSLTHGFMSGAIHRTDVSVAAIVAHELGLRDGGAGAFRRPVYGGPGDGLPVNIEALVRHLEREPGSREGLWQLAGAAVRARKWLDDVEDYWERGAGARFTPPAEINHNLGVYGWRFDHALERTARRLQDSIRPARDAFLKQVVQDHRARAGVRVLASRRGTDLTQFGAARELGRDAGDGADPDHGIETLLVMLGANHALETVVQLRVNWKGGPRERDEPRTVWHPRLFKELLDRAVAQVRGIRARHVIWGTVPHVTIAPVARGVERKVARGSRYFPYYTRPWITDDAFDPDDDRNITHQQARAVDSAIDDYNDSIAEAVIAARREGLDWHVLDLAGLLDRLAQKRYIDDRLAQPSWWSRYPLPPELQALDPPPDSAFFVTGPTGRRAKGGLFSLDGVHPTTIGYGILAQEIVRVMSVAGVAFPGADGRPRPAPVRVDFARLIAEDTLISDPPRSVDSTLRTIGWLDEHASFLVNLMT